MKILIQRVVHGNVVIDKNETASIQKGIVALIGIEKTDSEEAGLSLIKRVLNYRIFDDGEGKMNLSLMDVQGELLLVPQFTLVADTISGLRPGFSLGMPPQPARDLFVALVNKVKAIYPPVAAGTFGANMQVTLCNDGPVTFWLQS